MAHRAARFRQLFSWKIMLPVIAGISVLYIGVVASGHGSFIAGESHPYCPMMKKGESCTGDCMKKAQCTGKKCDGGCLSGNCAKRAA